MLHSLPQACKHLLYACFLLIAQPSEWLIAQCDTAALEIPKNGIDEDCDGLDDLYITLPPKIYLQTGQLFELYFHNLILSKHPQDYGYHVKSPLGGTKMANKWVILPSTSQVGTSQINIYVLDKSGNILGADSTLVIVSDPSIHQGSDTLRMMLLGHSFFEQGYLPSYLQTRLNQPGNQPFVFHGSKVGWHNPLGRHEGHSGKGWRWLKEGAGSPFLKSSKVNIPSYLDKWYPSQKKPDYLIVYLDVNDFLNYTDLNQSSSMQAIDDTIDYHWNHYAQPILDSLRLYMPNTKIGYCMVPPGAALQEPFDSLGASIPRLGDKWRWHRIVSRLHRKAVERWGNRETEQLYLIPMYLHFDAYTDYLNNDPVHPRGGSLIGQSYGGYNVITDQILAWMSATRSPAAQLFTFFRDADGDGYGNSAVTVQETTKPQGYVTNGNDCNDSNPQVYPGAPEICGNTVDENCNGILNEDNVRPIARCKSTVNQYLNAVGTLTVSALSIDNGSNDNCSQVFLSVVPNQFDCKSHGINQIELKAIDLSGNRDSCSTTIFVRDSTAPVVQCTDKFVFIGPDSTATFKSELALTYWFDNCRLDSTSLTKATYRYTCDDVDSSYTYTLTARDIHGNTGSCKYKVHIQNTGDHDFDGVPNCKDVCPHDAGTSTGYRWFIDLDGDGYGAGELKSGCIVPFNGVALGADCDDTNSSIYPGANEIFNNAIDEDCNGIADSTISVYDVAKELGIQVAPNPVSEILNIRSRTSFYQVTCLSVNGAEVFTKQFSPTPEVQLAVQNLPTGIYLLKIYLADGKIAMYKILK